MTADATWLAGLQEASFAGANAATRSSFPPPRRLTGPQLVHVLLTRRNGVLATTRKDGRPHSAPCAFVLFGRAIWLPVVAGAARAANVARQPWVSLVVAEGHGNEHGVVIIEGPATVVSVEPEGLAEAATAKLESLSWIDRWIRLAPAKLLSYAAEKWEHSPHGQDSGRNRVVD